MLFTHIISVITVAIAVMEYLSGPDHILQAIFWMITSVGCEVTIGVYWLKKVAEKQFVIRRRVVPGEVYDCETFS